MAESVKVFKNQNDVVPGDMDAAIDYTILTTSSTERAVIKDVSFLVEGTGAARVTPTLDLDGFTVNTADTGTSLLVDGTLIMGPSSTLKVKATPATGFIGTNYFRGMFFTSGSNTAQQYLVGDGATDTSITPTKIGTSTSGYSSAVTATVGGTRFFYFMSGSTIYKFAEQGTSAITSWNDGGSNGYQMTTDGTYIYRAAGTNNIRRSALSDHSTTALTTGSTVYMPSSNQGSYFLYHDGKIYTKQRAGETTMYIITLSNMSVVTKSDSDFNVGSYSDGACIVTTAAGVSYIIEQGSSEWTHYNIATDTLVRVDQAGGASTEYGNGAAEVAPGIALIFGESSDQATVIDINDVDNPVWNTYDGEHQYTTEDPYYGSTFSFAGYLLSTQPEALDFKYSVLASGIFIEE